MKKRNKFIVASTLLASLLFSTTGCNVNLEGAYAFMFKSTGNSYGNTLYEGFEKILGEKDGLKTINKSPSDATVGDQIKMIETLTLQKVSSITVSANATAGYDEVLKRATEKNIKIVSVDSPISPKYRTTHVDHCDTKEVGKFLSQAATIIGLNAPYPGVDGKQAEDFDEYVFEKIEEYSGTKKKIGVISSTADSPSQNDWIENMRVELDAHKEQYEKVIESTVPRGEQTGWFEVKYGNDESVASTDCANAFINDNIDIIVAPTTVAMAAAGKAITEAKKKNPNLKTRLTGLGMPSETKEFMALDPNENEFDYACPYMMLWRVDIFGQVAAQIAKKAVQGMYKGQVGEKVDVTIYDGDEVKTKQYETIAFDKTNPDLGTKIISLDPFVFYKGNMAEWSKKL